MQRKQVRALSGRRHHRAQSRWDDQPSPDTGDGDGVGMLPSERADEEARLTRLAWRWGALAPDIGLVVLVLVAALRVGAGLVRDVLRMSGPPSRGRGRHAVHPGTRQGP
jgi:hypothetical protein